MTRSPLTLAAAATSALPRVRVVAAAPLTTSSVGRFDSAVLTVEDDSRLVVRAPADAEAARDLAAEALALRALTPGVRALLGVHAPTYLGEAGLGDARALVTDFLPGYQVDAEHVPSGPGAAVSLGRALASVHALPASVVRAEGLPVRSPDELRAEVAALLDAADASDRMPHTILARWRGAVANDDVWRFESTVVLGGASATSFLFEDTDEGPTVTGVLGWQGLAVGDPATDLRWIASAPDAADDIFAAYQSAAHRAPDASVRSRARLYAELEFVRWLVHGLEQHRSDIVEDAVGLIEALADGVRDDDLVPAPLGEPLDDAIALLDSVAAPATPAIDTSMQTDAYDPEELASYLRDEDEAPAAEETPTDVSSADDDTSTAPIDISQWADARTADQGDDDAAGTDSDADAAAAEADRSAREALRRWASSE